MNNSRTNEDPSGEAPSGGVTDDLFGDAGGVAPQVDGLASVSELTANSMSNPGITGNVKTAKSAKSNQQSSASSLNAATPERHSLGHVLVPLMKGVVYKDADSQRWESLLTLQPRIQDHVAVLGLELILDEAEGYAFLRSKAVEEGDDDLPRLTVKRALSFPVSLLIALLRKRLVEFDVTGGDTRLVLSRAEIVDLLRLFLPDTSNEAKLIDQVDTHIKKVIDLGFLRKMKAGSSGAEKEERFEVKRIIRAFVDAQWLSEFDERLAEYVAKVRGDVADDTTGADS